MKQMTQITSILFLLAFVLFSTILHAQPVRLSEKDVNQQKLLIDANREKMLGNYDAAVALLKEILKEEGTDGTAAFELARIYEATGDEQQAVEYAEKAIELDDQNIWFQRFLADLFQKLNNNERAAAVFEKIVVLEPEDDFNYYRWAYFLVRAGDIKQALKVYDQLEERSGLNEELIRRKHSLYMGIGENKKAADELQRLINTFPRNVDYRYYLADFYEQIDEPKKAQSVYKDILQIAPDEAKAKLALSGSATSDEAQYLATLKPVFLQQEVNIDLKIGKIMPFIMTVADTQDPSLANATLELSTILENVHPSDAKGFAASADLLYHSGRAPEALEKYKKAIALDDTVYALWEQSMRIQDEQATYSALKTFSEEAMDFFPNQPTACFYHAKSLYQLGNSDRAVSLLKQGVLMSGSNLPLKTDILCLLGLVYNDLEKNAEVDAIFSDIRQNQTDNPFVNSTYAYILASRGQQLGEAQKMAAQSAKDLPDQLLPLQALAMVAYQQKQYNDAKIQLDKALALDMGQPPVLLEQYGDVLFELNDLSNALKYWKLAKQTGRSTKALSKKITANSN
jgi:tetratricopeptide (TPR) repeat protein